MKSLENAVRLYSCGAALITKTFNFGNSKTLDVSIPVRKTDLASVVQSIRVKGNVREVEPANYAPTNSKNTTLTIDAKNALWDTITKMAGSSVVLHEVGEKHIQGVIVGGQKTDTFHNNGKSEKINVVLQTDKGIRTIPADSVASIEFTEDTARNEYNAALRQMFQSIKPDSSFVNIKVAAEKENESIQVRYECPVASWKPRYSFIIDAEGKAKLIGSAIVDNDTDDDWTNTKVTVVTGQPITFNSDLAEALRPQRSRVNFVDEKTPGAVPLENKISKQKKVVGSPLRAISMGMSGGAYNKSAESYPADDEESLQQCASGTASFYGDVGFEALPEVEESGDFSVFSSPNEVTIRSKQSAIIPLFSKELDDYKTVLVYKTGERPYRAIRFKNENTFTLGRGPLQVENGEDFQGDCVLETTKPGEFVYGIHAVETGVRVTKAASRLEVKQVGIKIAKQTMAIENSQNQATTYTILNNKNEEFELEIEHLRNVAIPNSNLKLETLSLPAGLVQAETSQTKNGWRFTVKVPANGEVQLTATESGVAQYGQALVWGWFARNIFAVSHPLCKDKKLKAIQALQEKTEATKLEIEENEGTIDDLKESQTRLTGLIQHGAASDVNEWKATLGSNEKEIKNLSTKNKELNRRLVEEEKAVADAVLKLTITWTEEAEVAV